MAAWNGSTCPFGFFQERRRQINRRKSQGHRPGVLGKFDGTNRGLPQERKNSPKSKFWCRIFRGRARWYPGGRSFGQALGSSKNKHFGADWEFLNNAHFPLDSIRLFFGRVSNVDAKLNYYRIGPENVKRTNGSIFTHVHPLLRTAIHSLSSQKVPIRRGPRGVSHEKFHAAPSEKQACFLESAGSIHHLIWCFPAKSWQKKITCRWAFKTSTFGIMWCDNFWPNLRLEVAEGFTLGDGCWLLLRRSHSS